MAKESVLELHALLRVCAHPRLDEWAHQPRPYGPLMVRSVTFADATAIMRDIRWVVGRQRAEALRGEQSGLDCIDDGTGSGILEQWERQTAAAAVGFEPFLLEQRRRGSPHCRTSRGCSSLATKPVQPCRTVAAVRCSPT